MRETLRRKKRKGGKDIRTSTELLGESSIMIYEVMLMELFTATYAARVGGRG